MLPISFTQCRFFFVLNKGEKNGAFFLKKNLGCKEINVSLHSPFYYAVTSNLAQNLFNYQTKIEMVVFH